jgi:uncharacterized protein with ParB-like and HNH nuclease domain/predicted transport protein
MNAVGSTIFQILDDKIQFFVPIYQRSYSWENEQCERLWKDIVDMQKNHKAGHFIGSIVDIIEQGMPGTVKKYMLIDGQQRITTIMLLLIALRDYAKEHPEDKTIDADSIECDLLRNVGKKISPIKGDDRFKLLLQGADSDVLINLIEGTLHKEKIVSRLKTNYDFFREQIRKKTLSPEETYKALGKLQIVNITLDRSVDDAQAIFESLNSTGKPLAESDLIRNYLLMDLEPEAQADIYESLWQPMENLFEYENRSEVMDNFFRDYLTMKTNQIPTKGRVYKKFKEYCSQRKSLTANELCKDLSAYAGYYTNMLYPKSEDKVLRSLYADISNLRMGVAYPFLMKVHKDQADGLISEDDLVEILKMCINYVLRRKICEIPTNSSNKTFATMKNAIRPKDYVNSVKAYFNRLESNRRFPKDEEFVEGFKTRKIYKMQDMKFILGHLENYDHKEPIEIDDCTIEHIMPQNPNLNEEWRKDLGPNWKEVHDKYLHTIGNLTITAYNSELSDYSFQQKRDMKGGFKDSHFRLNNYVAGLSKWDESTIKERASQLAEEALEIWEYPHLTEEELKPYQEEKKLPIQEYSLDTYHFNEDTRELFDILDSRIMKLSANTNIRREYKQSYIAYKLDTNFADIVVQKKRLKIALNVKFFEIADPYHMCVDVTGKGQEGNGDVATFFKDKSEIDKVMDLIKQSYTIHSKK